MIRIHSLLRFSSLPVRFPFAASLLAAAFFALSLPLVAEEEPQDPPSEDPAEPEWDLEIEIDEPDSAPVDEDAGNVLVRVGPDGSIAATNEPAILGRGPNWRLENAGSLTVNLDSLIEAAAEGRIAAVQLQEGAFQNDEDAEISVETSAPLSISTDDERVEISGIRIDSWTGDSENLGSIRVTGAHALDIQGSDNRVEIAGGRFGEVPRKVPDANDGSTDENEGENGEDDSDPEEVPVPQNFRNTGTVSAEWSAPVDTSGANNALHLSGVRFDDVGDLTNEGAIEAAMEGSLSDSGQGNSIEITGVRGTGETDIRNRPDGRISAHWSGDADLSGNDATVGVYGIHVSEGPITLRNDGVIEATIGRAPSPPDDPNGEDENGDPANGEPSGQPSSEPDPNALEDGTIRLDGSGTAIEVAGVRLSDIPEPEAPEEENGDPVNGNDPEPAATEDPGSSEENGESSNDDPPDGEDPPADPVLQWFDNFGEIRASANAGIESSGENNTVRITGVHMEGTGDLLNSTDGTIEASFEGNLAESGQGNLLEVTGVHAEHESEVANAAGRRITARWNGETEFGGEDNTVRVTGVRFEDGGTLSNEGTIEGIFDGELTEFSESNRIEVTGVQSRGETTIKNEASGVIRATVSPQTELTGDDNPGTVTAYAIHASDGPIDLENHGLIEVVVGSPPAEDEGDNNPDNENGDPASGGLVTPTIPVTAAAIRADQGGFVHNAGTIRGDIDFGDGRAHLKIERTSEIDGEVTGGTGENLLELGGGGVGEYEGQFDIFPELKVSSARWTLVGDQAFPNGTEVSGGILVVNDTLTSDVTIQEAAFMWGRGTITGSVDVFGELSPGDADFTGTMTVDGDLVFREGSEFTANLGQTGANVTGEITIEDDVKLTVVRTEDTPDFRLGSRYDILEGAREGEFDPDRLNWEGFSLFLLPEVDYETDPNVVTVEIAPNREEMRVLAGIWQTRNQRQVAKAIAELQPAPGSKLEDLYSDVLIESNVFTFPLLADAISGEILASGALASAAHGRTFRSNLLNSVRQGPGRDRAARKYSSGGWHDYAGVRLAGPIPMTAPEPEPEPRHGFWTRAFGGSGTQDSDHSRGKLDYGLAGVVLGADTVVTDDTRAGAALGYTSARIDRRSDRVDSDIFHLAAYGSGEIGQVTLDGSIGYGFHDLASSRSVPGGRTRASYNGHEFFTTIQANVVRELDDLFVMPLVGLDYSHFRQGGFRESGPWALNVDSVTVDSLRAFAGLRLAMPYPTGGGHMIVPEMRFGYSHELLDNEATHRARIRGDQAGSTFVTSSAPMDRGVAQIGGGVMVRLARWEHVSLFIDYDGNLGGSQNDHVLSTGFRVTF